MGADRVGVVNSLIEEGELDQGQHDVAREVFVAPAGAVLVRTDLWRALGGFNPGIGEPGEDLDLSWRAHVAGARRDRGPPGARPSLTGGQEGFADRSRRQRPSACGPNASGTGCALCGRVTALPHCC